MSTPQSGVAAATAPLSPSVSDVPAAHETAAALRRGRIGVLGTRLS